MVKYDPHNHQGYYLRWKNEGALLEGVSEEHSKVILQFLEDMEIGVNVNPSSKKGPRSYGRLRNIKAKLQTLLSLIEKELQITNISQLENKDIEMLRFFKKMREEQFFCRRGNKPLTAIGTYVKVFKAFWHWYQRAQRRIGRDVKDITVDVDSRDEKPQFNYFTIEDLKRLCDAASHDYRVMMMFMFDSGIRAPTEMMNVRPMDLEWNDKQNFYTLNIREETSKTFGRKIKLLLCSDILRDYLAQKNFQPDDYIFKRVPQRVNQNLTYLGYKVLKMGKGEIRIRKTKYLNIKEGLTMYDFRHSSACYWLVRYKSENALKYRFGWKKSEMIHYYTELLGMKDTIQEDDLYTDISKTDLEQQIDKKGKEIEILQEQLQSQDSQMKEQENKMNEIMSIIKALQLEKQIAKSGKDL